VKKVLDKQSGPCFTIGTRSEKEERMEIKRTEKEIFDLLDITLEHENDGRQQYPGMSYEMGITAGIRWLLGETDDHPME
jgi:hypothetical protein